MHREYLDLNIGFKCLSICMCVYIVQNLFQDEILWLLKQIIRQCQNFTFVFLDV